MRDIIAKLPSKSGDDWDENDVRAVEQKLDPNSKRRLSEQKRPLLLLSRYMAGLVPRSRSKVPTLSV